VEEAFDASIGLEVSRERGLPVLPIGDSPALFRVDGELADPVRIFLKASSLPLVSSNSCLATASAVFALTSSSKSASAGTGCWLSVARIPWVFRLLDRFEKDGGVEDRF